MSNKHNKKCDDECVIKCATEVGVEVDAKPRVTCQEKWRRNTSFDAGVEFKVDPRCKIHHLEIKKSKEDPCKAECLFRVDIDIDCNAFVKCNPCGKPEAAYKVDVEIPYKANCKSIGNDCKDEKSHHSASPSKNAHKRLGNKYHH